MRIEEVELSKEEAELWPLAVRLYTFVQCQPEPADEDRGFVRYLAKALAVEVKDGAIAVQPPLEDRS